MITVISNSIFCGYSLLIAFKDFFSTFSFEAHQFCTYWLPHTITIYKKSPSLARGLSQTASTELH